MRILLALLIACLFDAPIAIGATEFISPTLINGKPVEKDTFKFVVDLDIRTPDGTVGCTGTLVAPDVVMTAAHCIDDGQTATFKIDGQEFVGTGRQSPLYQDEDHDIAVVILSAQVPAEVATPVNLGGHATLLKTITLLGYGCTKIGGGGGNDGILRKGKSRIIGYSGHDMKSHWGSKAAALCYGDSGGPAFVEIDGQLYLLGVNSKGNIRDTNYNTMLDTEASQGWLKQVAQTEGVEICGIHKQCPAIDEDGEPADEDDNDAQEPRSCKDVYKEFFALGRELSQCIRR